MGMIQIVARRQPGRTSYFDRLPLDEDVGVALRGDISGWIGFGVLGLGGSRDGGLYVAERRVSMRDGGAVAMRIGVGSGRMGGGDRGVRPDSDGEPSEARGF